jgi:hypothetical protein
MANRALKFLIVGLLSFALAQAQEAKPLARHPGDVIKYEIKFDGPNAKKVIRVAASLSLQTPAQKDQAGFLGTIGGVNTSPSSPKTFDVEITVPEKAATGDYSLTFTGYSDEGYGNYTNGQEFHVPLVHIENPKTFMPPSVTVKPIS